MHKTDGGLMESTTDTNRKQADKRNSQLKDGNEYDGGENACWKLPAELMEPGIMNCWMDKLPNADWWWYEAAFA